MSDRSIRIQGSATGSTIVSGEGNQVVIYYQELRAQEIEPAPPSGEDRKLGPNPYKGLAVFEEQDADRYFGREQEIQELWERLTGDSRTAAGGGCRSTDARTAGPEYLPKDTRQTG